jgi:UDP-2-acetamido-2-deoxy-ribo-hexuluronate aminotransferase
MRFLDLSASHRRYQAEIERRLQLAFEHACFVMGPEVEELESTLARYVGVANAVTVGNGSVGLELCLRALGIGQGDEVITPSFAWISSAEAIALVGATPVFVDIQPATFVLDCAVIEQAISPRTRAILPVSLFGQLADMETIQGLAERHGLWVIEDAAQSFGAERRGRRSGSLTHCGVTSFFPSKPLGCYGDGGAVFTDDAELASRVRALRVHGAERPGEFTQLGHNARLDTLQAAILLAKFPGLDAELAERRRLARRYDSALAGRVATPQVLSGNTHVYAQYVVRVEQRERLLIKLRERGIPTAVRYAKCLHEQPVFANLPTAPLPESERVARQVLSLPLHPYLSEADQDRVIDAVLDASC